MNKRIIFLAHSHVIHSEHWIKFFIKMEWDVYIISFHPKRISSAKNIYLNIGPISPTGGNYKYLKKLYWIIYYVYKIKPNILNSHFVSSFGILGYLTFYKNHIVNLYGTDIFIVSKQNKLKRLLIKKVLKRSKHIISVSDTMTKYLVDEFKIEESKITTIQYGIDTRLFKNVRPLKKRKYDFITNRSFIKNSNYNIILDAFNELVKKRPNLRLLIVGSGPLKDEINLMIDSMKLNDTITLMEFVNPLELVKLLNDAKIFLSFTSSDGTPLSLFEAMACGLYPIISNNLSNREWFNKGIIATCVNLDDLKHIVNSVESIYSKILNMNFQEHNKRIVNAYMDYNYNMSQIEYLFKKIAS